MSRSGRFRRELADGVLRLCCVAGVFAGLLEGLRAPRHLVRCTAALARCPSENLAAGMIPVLTHALAGFAVGAAVGVTLAMLVRRA